MVSLAIEGISAFFNQSSPWILSSEERDRKRQSPETEKKKHTALQARTLQSGGLSI
jgi:hypothetical protein